ncbi:hypothetical protein CHS0354_024165 [Potamilus streckersoni]|uniref:4-(cytidine 5'-diphospho)-2-C-methyl-D-erythritol kinase n=1 Tax=Potamilus streckersoni TaxID=2493646 RepID=A0AAE0RZR8_9BIVA|nr:hypothetical protein CHS0354_024165 [Potamilus streckersoni]
MRIDWHDTLTFTLTPTPQMTIINKTNTYLNTEDNLCIQASRLLQNKLGISRPISIELHKRIPMGAGLGGGSSNAATTLIALNHLLKSNLSVFELAQLGAKLGADVPFFIYNAPLAIAEGIGDIITPYQFHFPYPIVIAFPNEHVATAQAYNDLQLHLPKPKKNVSFLYSICKGKKLNEMKNDFEAGILPKFPKIEQLKKELLDKGASVSLMSGSGSAVFAIFESKEKATHCYNALKRTYPSNLTLP